MRLTLQVLAGGALLLCLAAGSAPAQTEDGTDAAFRAGLAALRAAGGQADEAERDRLLDEAVAAFRAILHDRPGLVRVLLELARAFYLKGEDGLARGHFERVLAGGPPPAVAANVRRFLAAIRERRRWTVHLGAAIAGDSSIGSASDAETVSIFGLLFRTGPEARPASGAGAVVWGGGEYQHPLSPRLRLRLGADALRREYAGSHFDETAIAAHAGPRRLIDARTEASLLATASRLQSRSLGLRAEAGRRLSPTVRAGLRASWEDRVFASGSGHDGYDGPVMRLGAHMAWLPAPRARLEGAAGYDRERAEAKRRRNGTRWGRPRRVRHAGARFYPRREPGAAPYALRRRLGAADPLRRPAPRPHPRLAADGGQPRLEPVRLQPPACARPRVAGVQRTASRLPQDPPGAPLPPRVLIPAVIDRNPWRSYPGVAVGGASQGWTPDPPPA